MKNHDKNVFLYESLWAAYPYPTFLINHQNKIDNANSAAEILCSNSIKNLIGSSISSFFGDKKIACLFSILTIFLGRFTKIFRLSLVLEHEVKKTKTAK